jgi:hypothetical protein
MGEVLHLVFRKDLPRRAAPPLATEHVGDDLVEIAMAVAICEARGGGGAVSHGRGMGDPGVAWR